MAYGKKQIDENFVAQPNPWEIRDKQRRALLAEYLTQFRNVSTIYADAVSGGWEWQLMKFVRAVADVQAQRIAGIKNIGWEGSVIFPLGTNQKQARVFLDEQYRIADTGNIDVAIPTGLIEHWKSNAEITKAVNENNGQPKLPSYLTRPKNEKLDAEINRQLGKYA